MRDRRDFLPVSTEDVKLRNWSEVDFVYVTGDAYVDHPSFGAAIITRVLEAEGFRVALSDTKEATELILKHPEVFVDYEIVKGKMDDVFLAATGKKLGGENV